ncbi:uncharacterized protein LOC122504248 [Leptopilina heterotoma]|uniref:uncharacterized protein LOC122504248 n=1 Tax=Leptopilina heterotoma TaxID=63436 RepID=UPI001CA800A0|nr:uncharacterized protein LOC122504248 [Leptopilina heterotoma]
MENYLEENSSITSFREGNYYSTENIVIRFTALPLQKAEKRIFFIQNNSGIVTNFTITVKNFFSSHKDEDMLSDENWERIKQNESGIVVLTKPSCGKLEPFEIKTIHIFAYADTWGEYNEEVSINIIGLEQFTFNVQIQVEDLPISYPICRNLLSKHPFLRFMKYDDCLKSRSLAIENTSCIPIIVMWHLFKIKNEETDDVKPLKLFLHIFSSFSFSENDDSKKLYSEEEKNRSRTNFNSFLKTCESNPSIKELNHFNSLSATNGSASSKETEFSENCSISEKEETEKNQVNIELSVLADFSEVEEKLLNIQPRELFIPPKEKRFLTVSFNSNASFNYTNSKICFQALGFIRTSPEHKYLLNLIILFLNF